MPEEVGRPSEYLEYEGEIRLGILRGNSFAKIRETLSIPEGTWDGWVYRNYNGFRDKLDQWRRDRLVALAEGNIEAIMCLGISDKETVKVVQDTSKFVLETLSKNTYSKRSEMSGPDGKELNAIVAINYVTPNNNNTDTEATPSLSSPE